MAAPKTTVWAREPHTEGKHLVFEHYLNAWIPIMASRNPRVLIVDGFAGPGEYLGGHLGSPVVAMRALAEHSARRMITAEVVFLFIEERSDRADHLQGLVKQWKPELPETAKVHVWNGSFDSRMTDILDQLDEQQSRLAPALVMMDPFGIKGIPMEVVRRILGNDKCEVYVTFMWEAINRHMATSEFREHMTSLFGTDEWRQAITLDGQERMQFLHGLYRLRLKAAGASHVVHFQLAEGSRLKYSIFFGTGHTKGSDRMKEAIWKADPSGNYRFRSGDQEQMSFLEPDYRPLQNALKECFEDAGWVSIEEIEEFVRSDATIYHAGQVRAEALKPMEREGRLEVDEDSRRNRSTYPKGCRINFRPQVLRFRWDDH